MRLIEETLPEESQDTPDHLHTLEPDQPGGVGIRDLANLAIIDASSAEPSRTTTDNSSGEATAMRRKKRRQQGIFS